MNLYEGMFLLDPALASDWNAAEAEVKRVMERAEAQIVGVKNWDERKLAYPIGKFRRGFYILTYFRAAPDKIAGMERDVQLSEKFLRAMFLNREQMSDEAVRKSLEAEPPKAARREERDGRDFRDRDDRGERGGRFDRGDRFDRGPRERREPVGVGAGESDTDGDMDVEFSDDDRGE